MKLEIQVTEDTLIPRADTEILVEEVLSIVKGRKNLLELCTGTGAIGIALAKYGDFEKVTMTDISKEALQIAKKNIEELLDEGKKQRISLLESDLFENIEDQYDIIVANPPYIKADEIQNYELKYEPQLALDGGEDGLKYYRQIIEKAHSYLTKEGILVLEIGYDQAEEVKTIIEETRKYKSPRVKKDLSQNDRVILTQTL
ncbi:MAG: peptide chain release factor N(5)-glutamine methyltransferase [Clostridia bacterium]|jgi:release factor glutamine methyltransferase|nr:peptide chain release factor N(5)-glutamine methyltransferase [Clostridia bacterium]